MSAEGGERNSALPYFAVKPIAAGAAAAARRQSVHLFVGPPAPCSAKEYTALLTVEDNLLSRCVRPCGRSALLAQRSSLDVGLPSFAFSYPGVRRDCRPGDLRPASQATTYAAIPGMPLLRYTSAGKGPNLPALRSRFGEIMSRHPGRTQTRIENGLERCNWRRSDGVRT
jgi:hypothetical protein